MHPQKTGERNAVGLSELHPTAGNSEFAYFAGEVAGLRESFRISSS